MYPRILALVLAAWCVSARAADLIPVEDFARLPKYSDAQLSPDGQFYAVLHEVEGRTFIEFANINGDAVQKFDPGWVDGGRRRDILWHRWLGSKRVLVGLSDGTAALNRDGSNWKPISGIIAYLGGTRYFGPGWLGGSIGARKEIYSFNDEVHVLMVDHGLSASMTAADHSSRNMRSVDYPEVIKVDTDTGSTNRVVTNPGQVVSWLPDRQGVVRVGIGSPLIAGTTVIYREDETSPWHPLAIHSFNPNEVPLIQGFTDDGKAAYISATNANGYRAISLLNLATGKLGEPLLEVAGYDVGLHAGVIWSDQKKAMVGYSYATEGPQVKWFDETFAQHMALINRTLPDTFNLPISISKQDRRLLILSSSDRNPGAYYLYSTQDKKLSAVVRTRPWIKPEQMASMNPITYTARDGVEIHGYLTLPQGQKPKNLPLIVLPHDRPFELRDKWGFDSLVQMLASRGYAVLQMNYRGSLGYGAEFVKKGQREFGGAIQQDIEDATRWAIAKKVADPKRIAIVGGGRFGGFSALYALGTNPDLYCCGISVGGVVDWIDAGKYSVDPASANGNKLPGEVWIKNYGDLGKDGVMFRAISPVNYTAKITAPVLYIYPKLDRVVPLDGVRDMMKALKKAGSKYELIVIDRDEGNSFGREKARIAEYKAIEAFLAKHLGPGAASAAATPALMPPGEVVSPVKNRKGGACSRA